MACWVGTSWKMNKTLAEGLSFAEALAAFVPDLDGSLQPFVIPPFTAVREVKRRLAGTRVKVGAQNMHWSDAGAWTGEISAAMGLTGLESVDEFIAVNFDHYCHYRRELGDLPGISMLSFSEDERSNYQYVVLEVDEAQAGLSRDDLLHVLHAENVRARRYFFPGCHRMDPYRDLYPEAGRVLPETERLTKSVLCLPTGTSLVSVDVEAICRIIRLAVTHAHEIRPLLDGRHRFLEMKDDQKR